LEQLDDIAARILAQDLPAAGPGQDLVAELDATLSQRRNQAVEVRDRYDEAVPSARLRFAPSGIG
jgi:hypothetical protein